MNASNWLLPVPPDCTLAEREIWSKAASVIMCQLCKHAFRDDNKDAMNTHKDHGRHSSEYG